MNPNEKLNSVIHRLADYGISLETEQILSIVENIVSDDDSIEDKKACIEDIMEAYQFSDFFLESMIEQQKEQIQQTSTEPDITSIRFFG